MYHVIAKPPAGTPYPHLWVEPADFAAQMLRLRKDGYRAVTLAQVYRAWHGRATLPRRPVVVTFDDGYASQHRHAFRVLRGMGWPGVLNLKLDALNEAGGLRASQVKELIRAGWEVDSHTFSHPDVTGLGAAELRHELVDSRRELRRRFGVPADFFCYPSGRYDSSVIRKVRSAGYLAATTTRPGLADPSQRYELARVRVNRDETPAALAATLRGMVDR
jgi:peptidoglycan/xylan/chitin deacetylase (PgdA/CDA1 family)